MTVSDVPLLLEVDQLNVTFATERGRFSAVNDITFRLGASEFLAIVGESGSGKTVTILSLLGLIDGRNTTVTGSAMFRGQQILGLPDRKLRRIRGKDIAYIPQDPLTAMTPVHTVGWQIVEQIRAHESVSQAVARRRALELLGEVGLPNPAAAFDRYPHQFSGGMRQRAMIAMALSCNPVLIVADEPTTALDVTVQAQVMELLKRLQRDFSTAVILVTHDLGVVYEVADRVIVMYAGRVAEKGTRDEVFGAPQHPYTWGLLNSIPPVDGIRPHRLPSIPGTPPVLGRIPSGCGFGPRCAYRFGPCDGLPPRLPRDGHAAFCFLDAPTRAALTHAE